MELWKILDVKREIGQGDKLTNPSIPSAMRLYARKSLADNGESLEAPEEVIFLEPIGLTLRRKLCRGIEERNGKRKCISGREGNLLRKDITNLGLI